jgi:hypothetical protein
VTLFLSSVLCHKTYCVYLYYRLCTLCIVLYINNYNSRQRTTVRN